MIEELIAEIRRVCDHYGINFVMLNQEKVHTPEFYVPCSGFFDDRRRILAVATGKPESEWLPILIHEYCHLKQWIEFAPVWQRLEHGLHEDRVDAWMARMGTHSDEELDDSIQRLVDVEGDCERRVIELIKEYNLPINTMEYAQKALSYVLYYYELRKTRKWYVKPPYQVEAIWSQFPTSIPEVITKEYAEHVAGTISYENI